MKHINNTVLILGLVIFVLVVGVMVWRGMSESFTSTTVEKIIEEKKHRMEQIIEGGEFQQKIQDEAEKIYLLEVKQETDERLLELQDSGFTGEKVSAVRGFLNQYDSELAYYVEDIIALPRWQEAVAITGKETSFCKAGVGESRNNCGAIKNYQTGEFKVYRTKFDAIEDVSYLLQKELYIDKSISEMNGIYCVHEEGDGGECPNWTETIEGYINEIYLAMI